MQLILKKHNKIVRIADCCEGILGDYDDFDDLEEVIGCIRTRERQIETYNNRYNKRWEK